MLTKAYIVPHPPLIIPEIGGRERQRVKLTIGAMEQMGQEIAMYEPELIIISTPHTVLYSDYFHISPGKRAKGDFGSFGAREVKFEKKYDEEFRKALIHRLVHSDFPAGSAGEEDASLDHATMVPLYFIDKYYTDYKILRVGLSMMSLKEHYRLGQMIQETVKKLDRKVVFVSSGDLSHCLLDSGPYEYREEGVQYDALIQEILEEGDFYRLLDFPSNILEEAGECGHRSFTMMAGALDGFQVKPKKHSYEGPFGVGYGVFSYEVIERDSNRCFLDKWEEFEKNRLIEIRKAEDPFISLARESLETYIRTGKKMKAPVDIPKDMEKPSGVFVSLKKDGILRGCIGTIVPSTPTIVEEIIQNAISAGIHDPRFPEVTKQELDSIVYSVDVLGEPKEISSVQELDTNRYGVIVTSGRKTGLLLPRLEGVTRVEDQVNIAKRKAGIRESDKVKLERFEVVRHE